jgi:hypothetical protein
MSEREGVAQGRQIEARTTLSRSSIAQPFARVPALPSRTGEIDEIGHRANAMNE